MAQKTSGRTLSQELIRYVEVNQETIDRFRFGSTTIKIADGRVQVWTWTREERRGKEITYL